MKAIIIFVCLFTNRMTSQSADVFPGKIFTRNKVISEGSEITFKCSPHGSGKSSTLLYLYLCKDGQGIQRKRQKLDQTDITFTVKSVNLYDSGNYSCVYSPNEHEPSIIFKSGSNTIGILVKAAFLPAQISLVGSSTVTEGDIFELQCTVDANMEQTHTDCTHIRSYLMRNNTVARMEAFSIKDMKATFAIQGATVRDSGQYSCVVFPSRCVREEDAKFRGNNTLTVHVEEYVSYWGVVVMGLLSTLMILGFFLFIIVKQRQILTAHWRKRFTVTPVYTDPGEMREETQMDVYHDPDRASQDSFALSSEENLPNGAAFFDHPDEAYIYPVVEGASRDSFGMSAEENGEALPDHPDGDYIFPDNVYADVQDLYSRCSKVLDHQVQT